MDLLAFARSLLDAGGWTVVIFMVVGATFGLWRKIWVPGFWFDDKVAALTSALAALAEVTKANVDLRVENARLKAENARERRSRDDAAP